jgi:hypothetical protein
MSSDAVNLDGTQTSQGSQAVPLPPAPVIDPSGVPAAMLGNQIPPVADVIETAAPQQQAVGPKEDVEESPEARIERLGRQRPEKFKTIWAEIGFVFSIVMSQVMTVSFYFSTCPKVSSSVTSGSSRYGHTFRG